MTERTCRTCGETIHDIVALVMHECEEVLSAIDLTRSEQSTLLYVGGRMVDHRGQLDPEQMNYEDYQNLKVFFAAGIIEVSEGEGDTTGGRGGPRRMDVVEAFTDQAWRLESECRQMRAAQRIDREVDLGAVPGRHDQGGRDDG